MLKLVGDLAMEGMSLCEVQHIWRRDLALRPRSVVIAHFGAGDVLVLMRVMYWRSSTGCNTMNAS